MEDIKKIYTVWVYASNIQKTKKFYENALGLKAKYEEEDWIEFDTGTTSFTIHKTPEKIKPQITRIMFETNDLAGYQKKFQKLHVKIVQIRKEVYGSILTFEDLDGNRLELYQPKVN